MAFTGLTANTKNVLQLDAGALYKNFIPGTDTAATATTKLIGATVGGSTISIVPEVRQISVDGVKGPTKGFETFDSWTATLTANLKEITKGSVALALGAVSTDTSVTGYTKTTIKSDIGDNDYLTNITWIGKISGAEKPMIIVLKNALCTNGFNFTVADKAEGQIPITMTAHYDVTNIEEVPVEIYTPEA